MPRIAPKIGAILKGKNLPPFLASIGGKFFCLRAAAIRSKLFHANATLS